MALVEFSFKLFNGASKRSSLENPSTPLSYPAEWLLDIFNGGRTDSGIRVSEMTALQVSTILTCCNIIGNGIAGLPLKVYEKLIKAGRLAKSAAVDHSLFDLLHDEPNSEMTSFTWRKTLMVHALLWGNFYCEIERNGKNQIVALWPRNPARTRPVRLTTPTMIEGTAYPTGTMVYETNETRGDSQMTGEDSLDNKLAIRRIVLSEDMLHVPGLSLDGRLGQSTVYLARQTIGLSLALEKYGAKFFGNNARPAGVLEVPGTMEAPAVENLRRSWAEAHGGENAHKTALLEAGVKYTKIGATPEEAQSLQTRNYIRTDIATLFNVPPHMVGETEKAKSNVEQSSIEFVLYCLGPWLTAWEQELKRKLFPKMGAAAKRYFAKFDVRRLMYPDAESRSAFYACGRQWGFLNGDDIRELEDMDPIGGPAGNSYWMPTNMMDAGDINQIAPPGSIPPAGPKPPEPEPEPKPPAGGKGGKTGTPGKPAKNPKAKPKGRSLDGTATEEAWLLEQGEPTGSILRGWSTAPLDAAGVSQAHRAAGTLAGQGIARIVSCDLVRARQAAAIIATDLGYVPVTLDAGLRAWNVGAFVNKEQLQPYIDNPDEPVPGGESLTAFKARSAKALADMLDTFSEPILFITSDEQIAPGSINDGMDRVTVLTVKEQGA